MISRAGLPLAERLLIKLTQRREIRAPLDGEDTRLEERTFRERFTQLAMRHGVHGLVLSAIVEAPLVSLSAEVVEEFKVAFAQLRRRALVWDMERDRLLLLLQRKGLIPVVLKGGSLRETIYDQPAERSVGDLDLLFPDDQVQSAIETLQASGYRGPSSDEVYEAYRQHHFHFLLTHPGGFVVEVHWALSKPNGSFRLDTRAFLARAVEKPRVARPPLRVPSAEDMLLHMASQNVEDAFGRLRRVVDVDRIIASTPHLDWNYLRQAARHGDVQILTAVALRLSELLLGTPVPRGFVESLGVTRLTRLHLALLRVPWTITRGEDRHVSAAELVLLWTTVSGRQRLRRCAIIASVREDPLAWVWQGKEGADGRKGRLHGLSSLGKLAAYQAWVYVSGIAALLTRSGRRGLRFWTEPGPPSDLR